MTSLRRYARLLDSPGLRALALIHCPRLERIAQQRRAARLPLREITREISWKR